MITQETKQLIEKSVQPKNKSVIKVEDLHKSFGKNNEILKGVNLSVRQGENLVVLGKSGSGKSVTIK